MEASERLALASVLVNICVAGLKYFLGIFAGSLALLADAVHSSADIVSSATIWAGIRISRRKSKRFPYGLYKVENLAALFTAVLILLAGFEIARTVVWSGERLRAERLPYALAGVSLIALILLSFSRFELARARKLASPSLAADAQHLATDLFSTCVILTGLAGAALQVAFPLDKAAALVIVGLIAWVGIRIAIDAIRVLLDASVDFQVLNVIREIILKTPQVARVNSLTGRNSGRFKFIEVELSLKVRELEKAHLLATQIEARIKSQVPNVDHILIHYEPVEKETRVIALPVAEDRVHLSEHFGGAPYFLVLTLRNQDQEVLEERLLANPYRAEESGKGIRVGEWLVSLGVDEVITGRSYEHKGPYYVLANAGVVMTPSDEQEIARIKAGLTARQVQSAQGGSPSG
jgi:cation diffusion facilitator family transporter